MSSLTTIREIHCNMIGHCSSHADDCPFGDCKMCDNVLFESRMALEKCEASIPVSALVDLRDWLYENDAITFKGLKKLNKAIHRKEWR